MSSQLLTCWGGCPATFRCCHSCVRSCSCSRCRGGSAGPCCPLPWDCLHSPQHDLHPTKNQNLKCSVAVIKTAFGSDPMPAAYRASSRQNVFQIKRKGARRTAKRLAPVASPVLIYALTCIPLASSKQACLSQRRVPNVRNVNLPKTNYFSSILCAYSYLSASLSLSAKRLPYVHFLHCRKVRQQKCRRI